MNLVTFHSFWTVALLILFIGIVIWAFSSRRKRGFDEAARLPLEDEDYQSLPLSPGGRGQGERGETVPNAIRGGKQHG